MSCLSVFVLPSAITQALLPDQAPSSAPVLGLPVQVAMGAAFCPEASIADISAKESNGLQNTDDPLAKAVGHVGGGI